MAAGALPALILSPFDLGSSVDARKPWEKLRLRRQSSAGPRQTRSDRPPPALGTAGAGGVCWLPPPRTKVNPSPLYPRRDFQGMGVILGLHRGSSGFSNASHHPNPWKQTSSRRLFKQRCRQAVCAPAKRSVTRASHGHHLASRLLNSSCIPYSELHLPSPCTSEHL